MLQQLLTTNRFVSLAPDDPDNSDTDPEATEPHIVNKPQDDVSTVSDDTVYYLLMMAPPTSKQGLNLSQEKSGKSPSLLISKILMECYALATNLTQISAPSKKLKLSFLATTALPNDPAETLRGGLILTPLMRCKARTPLDWTHAWAMLGEWAGKIAFPIPEDGKWPRHGHGIYLRPDYIHRTPPFLTWARPIFEQGALSPMSFFSVQRLHGFRQVVYHTV